MTLRSHSRCEASDDWRAVCVQVALVCMRRLVGDRVAARTGDQPAPRRAKWIMLFVEAFHAVPARVEFDGRCRGDRSIATDGTSKRAMLSDAIGECG